MAPSDAAIDLDIGEISVRFSAKQRVGPDEATEPGRIAGSRGHGLCFIDQEARQPAMLAQQFPQAIQKVLVGYSIRIARL
jgi:hypothetical protein